MIHSKRLLLAAGSLLLANCQCFQPVFERGPGSRKLDATTAEAFLKSLQAAYICGQASACGARSSHVTCDQLINEPGHHYAALWDARVAADLDAGIVTYDPVAGRKCLERLQTECGIQSCSADALTGHRTLGETCAWSAECAPGLRCAYTEGSCSLCEPLLGDGEETSSWINCSEGAADLVDGGARCYAFRQAGESCAAAADETSVLRCKPGLACIAGVCGAPLPEGAACTWGQCALGLGCSEDAGCTPLGDLGQPCPCRRGLECRDGACALLRDVGESCSWVEDCRAPLGCSGGVCAALGGVGTPCSDDWACEGPLSCRSSGSCGSPAGLGETCVRQSDCAASLLCEQGRCLLHACR